MQRNPSSRRPPVHQRPLPPVRKVVRPQQRKLNAKAGRRPHLPR